jgi:hypothetical protein
METRNNHNAPKTKQIGSDDDGDDDNSPRLQDLNSMLQEKKSGV